MAGGTTAVAAADFELRLDRALERVRVVLGTEKSNALAGQVHHQYQDKYHLAEQMTSMAAASQLNCLCLMGLTAEAVERVRGWSAKGSAVSLRFRTEEHCKYDREETREVEGPTKHVEEHSVGTHVRSALTHKVVHTVVEHFWRYEVSYELLAVRGVGAEAEDRLCICSRAAGEELKTSTKSPPHPDKTPSQMEVNVSWLLQQLQPGTATPAFRIHRDHKKCHTPRRNPDIEAALVHFADCRAWAGDVAKWLKHLVLIQPDPTKRLHLASLDKHNSLLVPVLPLLREGPGAGSAPAVEGTEEQKPQLACPSTVAHVAAPGDEVGSSTLATSAMGAAELNQLLGEEQRALRERRAELEKAFPSGAMVASIAEASLVVMLQHTSRVSVQWAGAIDYIESLLFKQLIAAIGKEVSPADFAEYMRFHNRKVFSEAYMPSPFCFAVRRSAQHTPEGAVSIEEEVVGQGGDSHISAPILTMCCKATSSHPMKFPLNASASVSFEGDRYLHAWLSHQFSGESGAKVSLVARARQFSSMLVLVGRISSATTFQPKYAAIIQNKDELTIPLDLSTIPTPKEFKDAIESLSPEQQAFATAFRQMQLESTLFGVLVIHIKPQLERVLNLPEDALTKEIKLTQELMQLFIKYQVPSDLLAFDAVAGSGSAGTELVGATASERLAAVKAHVGAMNSMIEAAKQEELQERQMEERYAHPLSSDEDESAVELAACENASLGFRGRDAKKDKEKLKRRCRQSYAPPVFLAAPPPPPPPMACAPTALLAAAEAAPAAPAAAAPQPQVPHSPGAAAEPLGEVQGVRDYTQVPKEMDERFEELDAENALRPTIISPGELWTKRAQKALLADPVTSTQGKEEQKREKDAAFDLLDALTKSGALPISHASLHIVVAATHCFDKTLMDTVVQDNANPIEKVECSTLIMASTVHGQPAAALIRDAQLSRVKGASPQLFLADAALPSE